MESFISIFLDVPMDFSFIVMLTKYALIFGAQDRRNVWGLVPIIFLQIRQPYYNHRGNISTKKDSGACPQQNRGHSGAPPPSPKCLSILFEVIV